MKQNIHIITLGVANMARALAFYEEGLGWKRSSASQGDIVFYQLSGMVFALYPHDKLAEDVGVMAAKQGFSGVTIAYNTTSEEEVDSVLTKVTSLGAKIVKPATKVFWGGYSGYFEDLDGHLFEVAYNPFVTFDANGNLKLEA